MAQEKLSVSMDSLLDSTLDDIADLPEFRNLVPGAHLVTIQDVKLEGVKTNSGEVPAWKIEMTLDQTLEQVDPNEAPNEVGSVVKVSFLQDNEFGQGNWKMFFAVLSAITNTSSPRALLDAGVKGTQVIVQTGLRSDKEDKSKKYLQIKGVINPADLT